MQPTQVERRFCFVQLIGTGPDGAPRCSRFEADANVGITYISGVELDVGTILPSFEPLRVRVASFDGIYYGLLFFLSPSTGVDEMIFYFLEGNKNLSKQ